MSEFMRVLLALVLAHLLGDFVLQSDRMVAAKHGRGLHRARAWLAHGSIHFALALAALAIFAPGSAALGELLIVLLTLTAAHLALDRLNCGVGEAAAGRWKIAALLADQAVHLAMLVVVTMYLTRVAPAQAFGAAAVWLAAHGDRVLALLVIYAAVIFAAGYPIGVCTDRLMGAAVSGERPHLGMYIGWLERFLVVTSVALASPVSVGLILTAKSIARYPKFAEEHFAEVFLIGTLLSMSIALAGGLALAHLSAAGASPIR